MFNLFSSRAKPDLVQKGVVQLIPLLLVVGVFVIAVAVLLSMNKGGAELKSTGTTIPITPSQLMPSVTSTQARSTICEFKKEGLFGQICQEKFNNIGKEDSEKIVELFSLLNEIQNNKNISDYDRLLLGQLIFASLPNKDSPLSRNFYLPSLVKTAYAQEQSVGAEEFKALMQKDLQNVLSNLPEGDNAWVMNVMVSKYQWIDGQRQPIYSDQYSANYDPYPGVSTEPRDESKIRYNIRSIVGSWMSSQMSLAEATTSGTSEMIVYSFSMHTYYSPPYGKGSVLTVAESGPDPQYLTSRYDFTEEDYGGENLISDLLSKVEMPSQDQPKSEEPKSKTVSSNSTHTFTREECQEIADILPVFNTIWIHADLPGDSCVISAEEDSNVRVQDALITYANFSISFYSKGELQDAMNNPLPYKIGNEHKPFDKTELNILGGKAIVTTLARRILDQTFGENYIDNASSNVAIFLGNCLFGYAGGSQIIFDPNEPDEAGKYHLWDTQTGRPVNTHPDFDHGASKLHQMMVDMVPQVTEAVKHLCGI
jgi:hypothetical protein